MRLPLIRELRDRCTRAAGGGVRRHLPPAWFGYRWVARETVPDYFARRADVDRAALEIVHPESVAENPLPCNVQSRDRLPAERGWWGYSFRDVPSRTSAPTFIATIPDCRITWYHDANRGDDFYPAILTGDGRALELRELRFRPAHAETLRRARHTAPLQKATWIFERVYHNHSHWLTAHLPKFLLLRDRGALADVLLPPERTPVMDESLRAFGLDPARFPTFPRLPPLHVAELTIIGTDRFRPELLRLVPQACGIGQLPAPHRRVFISRAKASRRTLVNEDDLWRLLQGAGFERVHMEELTFAEQMSLMHETAVLLAPHGAGLTNMMFCPPGAHIVEIADLSFPNPNFYALASAMNHRYWLLPGEPVGDGHPLQKDLRADLAALREVVRGLPA